MANDDFFTSLPSQWALLEPFPTHITPSDTFPSHWGKKRVPKQTFRLSPTLPTNEWFRRVSNPGRLLHHDTLPSPIEKGNPINAPVPHAPPTTRPPPKPPDYDHDRNKKNCLTPQADYHQGLGQGKQSFLSATPTSTATSHTIHASLAYIHNRQQSAINGVHLGHDQEKEFPTEQQPHEARIATPRPSRPQQPATPNSPVPTASHGYATSTPLESLDSMRLPAEMTEAPNQAYTSKRGNKGTFTPLLTSMTHSEEVRKTSRTAQYQAPFSNIQDSFFSSMKRTLADMQSDNSPLTWTMLLPSAEESRRLTYAWRGKLEDFCQVPTASPHDRP